MPAPTCPLTIYEGVNDAGTLIGTVIMTRLSLGRTATLEDIYLTYINDTEIGAGFARPDWLTPSAVYQVDEADPADGITKSTVYATFTIPLEDVVLGTTYHGEHIIDDGQFSSTIPFCIQLQLAVEDNTVFFIGSRSSFDGRVWSGTLDSGDTSTTTIIDNTDTITTFSVEAGAFDNVDQKVYHSFQSPPYNDQIWRRDVDGMNYELYHDLGTGIGIRCMHSPGGSNMLYVGMENGTLYEIDLSAAAGAATATELQTGTDDITCITSDNDYNLYFWDRSVDAIRKWDGSVFSTVLTPGASDHMEQLAYDLQENVIFVSITTGGGSYANGVHIISADGTYQQEFISGTGAPTFLFIDSFGRRMIGVSIATAFSRTIGANFEAGGSVTIVNNPGSGGTLFGAAIGEVT